MAHEVLMPRQGNTVESCIILEWRKNEGDPVKTGDILCEVETDKATFEVEAEADGILLKQVRAEGDDVPVLEVIAFIGEAGESVPDAGTASETEKPKPEDAPAADVPVKSSPATTTAPAAATPSTGSGDGPSFVSPRAKRLAEEKGIDASILAGSGAEGRVIEQDVLAAIEGKAEVSPAALAAMKAKGLVAPATGSGIGGRVLLKDLQAATAAPVGQSAQQAAFTTSAEDTFTEIPVKGVRKITAERMHQSIATTAQLTMHTSADARAMMELRKKLKGAADEELQGITFNDMVLFAVSRTVTKHKDLNAHFLGDKIVQFDRVHLGFAVDTPRGLMVPVIRNADLLSLRQISLEAKRLAMACMEGKIAPEEMQGGTFTISNLGNMGIEMFTPVLNIPQVTILGVCSIEPKPVMKDGAVDFVPSMGFSLTIDHQAVDGAPASRFLKEFTTLIGQFDLMLAG